MADIELVVKLPEELLSKINDENYQSVISWYDTTLYYAILSGTPLPKKHGRLKDVDALESHDEYDGQGFTKSVYKDDIDNALTIIEAEG